MSYTHSLDSVKKYLLWVGSKRVLYPACFSRYVQRAQSKSERSFRLKREFNPKGAQAGAKEGVNLYIKNLDESIDDEKLREHFCTFGKITSASAQRDLLLACRGD